MPQSWCKTMAGQSSACLCHAGWMRRANRATAHTTTSCASTVNEAGLSEAVVFHDWINEDLISEYYSLADVTMCIGNCVETCGNTPFESLGCGTPPVLSRVATYRDLLSDEHVDRVDYGDIDDTARRVNAILLEKRRTSPATIQYLRTEFSQDKMVSAYASVILNAVKKQPLYYQVPRLTHKTAYRLAPWCYHSPQHGIYHDFLAAYHQDDRLAYMVEASREGFSAENVDPSCIARLELTRASWCP